MTLIATKVRQDTALHAKFYAEGRRDSNMMKYHRLDTTLFMISAQNAQKLAEAHGVTNWSVEKFFMEYAKQLSE